MPTPKQTKQTIDLDESRSLDLIQPSQQDLQEFKALLGEISSSAAPASRVQSGQILEGTVVEVKKDYIVVDVGLKSEGLIPIGEFKDSVDVAPGQSVEVFLEELEGEHGQIVLSREKALKQREWETITQNYIEGSIVTGMITRKIKGGMMVDIMGVEAFLPGSQLDIKKIKQIDDYVGKSYEFKILKINLDRKNIVVSRRELLEDERHEKKAELLQDIQVGDIRKGVVKNITDFGVFLDLDGIDGLLHITDMSWKRLRHPSEMVNIGDVLEVIILSIDREKGRVALGYKQKEENPWVALANRYPVGSRVRGKITNLFSYGAFMEIEDGFEGLIHCMEMSWTRHVTDPSQVVSAGQEVEAIVLAIQADEGKISLGLKQLETNPWDSVEEKYKIGSVVEAEVRNLTNYGAFVALEPGIDALIHISDFSWTKKISHPSEMLKRGENVKAVVLSVDRESRKITLGIKQLQPNPWQNIEKELRVGQVVNGKVSKVNAYGVNVIMDNGLEGLIHANELNEFSDASLQKVAEAFPLNSSVTVKITRIDQENKRIFLARADRSEIDEKPKKQK